MDILTDLVATQFSLNKSGLRLYVRYMYVGLLTNSGGLNELHLSTVHKNCASIINETKTSRDALIYLPHTNIEVHGKMSFYATLFGQFITYLLITQGTNNVLKSMSYLAAL